MLLRQCRRYGMTAVITAILALQTATAGRAAAQSRPADTRATVREMIDARTDVWGEAVIAEGIVLPVAPDGAVDLSDRERTYHVRFMVRRQP